MDSSIKFKQNIYRMSDFSSSNAFSVLAQVEAYWDALRVSGSLPKRSQIDPRGIETALEYAFILERVASGVARMRLAGSHLHDLMGMEVRGMPLAALFEATAGHRVGTILEEVFQTPATAEIRMCRANPCITARGDARMILLPLRSDLGDVSRALGCLVCPSDGVPQGRRFTLEDVQIRPVDSTEPTHPAADRPARQAPGFAEPKSPFDAGKKAKDRPPYLRLVKTDDDQD